MYLTFRPCTTRTSLLGLIRVVLCLIKFMLRFGRARHDHHSVIFTCGHCCFFYLNEYFVGFKSTFTMDYDCTENVSLVE